MDWSVVCGLVVTLCADTIELTTLFGGGITLVIGKRGRSFNVLRGRVIHKRGCL